VAKAGPRRAGAAAGQRDRSAQTRAALVEGAIEALRTAGFAGASAREIARRAGCNQTLVFYHFGSVTDLLLAALDAISERRMAAYRGVLDHAGSLTDLVESARSIFTEEMLANLDGDRAAALALFDRASTLAALLDMTGALPAPGEETGGSR